MVLYKIRIIMKAQFLKIAKVKDEKAFYKKYPTEAAFFKAHPEAKASIKKAQIGAYIGGERTPSPKPISYQDMYDEVDEELTGTTAAERLDIAEKQAAIAAASKSSSSGGGGGGFDIGSIASMFGGGGEGGGSVGEGIMSSGGFGSIGGGIGSGGISGGRNGKYIPRAQVGATQGPIQGPAQAPSNNYYQNNNPYFATNPGPTGLNNPAVAAQPQQSNSLIDSVGQFAGPVTGLVKGFEAIQKQRNAMRAAKQAEKVSGLALQAEKSKTNKATISERKYVRPEDNITQAGQMFPTYGVGTNVLARNGMRLQGGGEIQNTYAPDYLYDDLGYEPLNDSNVKQYYHGGGIPRAQDGGGFSNFMGAGGTDALSSMVGQGFDNNAGYQIGSSVGNIVKMIPGVGGVVGAVAAPVLGAIGGAIDNIWGDGRATKNAAAQAQRNMESISNIKTASGIHAANTSVMEDGGWVSHDWQPQVITQFGGLDQQDFYDYAHDGMQSLRAGGHIRGEYQPISNRGMQQYAMGGEVQTTWGGHAETISHNPYMPGTGETIMFRGKSHDESDGNGNTGIGVKYGKGKHDSYTDYAEYGTQEADADVEVERGEPAAELQDANGEKNLTVYGNLKIPNQYLDLLGDKNAKGKKFKNYVADLSKIEAKQNKIVEKSTNIINDLEVNDPFSRLTFAANQANILGANMKLKDIADKKMNAAYLQNAINDTAEENGLVADDLAKGKVKVDKEALQEYAEYGKTIKKAKDGVTTDDKGKKITKAERERLLKSGEYKVDPSNPNRIYRVKSKSATSEQKKSASAMDKIPVQKLDKNTGFAGGVTKEKFEEFKKRFPDYPGIDKLDPKDPISLHDFKTWANAKAKETGSNARILDDPKTKSNPQGLPIFGDQFASFTLDESKKETPGATESDYLEVEDEDKVYDVNAKKRNPWVDLAGQILPFFRPSDQEAFDIAQLYPEMYALSSNQLEPVQAQGFQPDLATPYDISYQDMLNANQADYNASQKMVGYNPAAQSILNAQKYAANEKVLGEQFRANQAMQAGVYNQNRQVLNDAKLKNLDIFDRQYTRQEQAKSNTKAVTQAALNSIADKYAKHKLENRTLGVYENLYNYRYDDKGRAINMNAPWQANLPNLYDKGNRTANMREVYDKQGNFLRYEPIEEDKTVTDETLDAAGRTPGTVAKKNGGKVKAKNGSIVSAYKNL